MSNKHSASEDDIGKLHKLITMCHNMKTKSMLEVADALIEAGGTAEEIAFVINSRDLTAAQKWVEYNGVSCLTADSDEESELSKRLSDLRDKQEGKIVSFEDIKAEAMGG